MTPHGNSAAKPTKDLQPLAYTVKDACAVSGIGRAKLYELISSGELKSSLVAGRRLILRETLIAFLQGEKEAA